MTHAIALVRLAVLATLVAAGACGDSSPADPIDARPQGMIDARSRLEVDGTPIAPDAPTDLCAGIDCSSLDEACHVGTCDPTDGTCMAEPVVDGTTCDDGDPCTSSDACTAGVCGGTSECPGMTFAESTDTALRGHVDGGTETTDDCPDGQVLIGVDATTGGSINSLAGVCGTASVSGVPGDLSVTISDGATLPVRGTAAGDAKQARCPADQVVIGFEGTAGQLLDSLALRCAPLSVSGSRADGFIVTPGTATTQPAISGTGASGPFPASDCASGDIATGLITRHGNAIDALALRCSTPTAAI